VELLNSYNLQYPNFSSPYLTVSTTSKDFPAVHQTFNVVTKLLIDQFTASEVRNDVAPNNRIAILLEGDTGPLLEQGSSKRALAGLILLTLIAIFAVATFLDRHPIRLLPSARRRTPESRPSAVRVPRIRSGNPAAPDY